MGGIEAAANGEEKTGEKILGPVGRQAQQRFGLKRSKAGGIDPHIPNKRLSRPLIRLPASLSIVLGCSGEGRHIETVCTQATSDEAGIAVAGIGQPGLAEGPERGLQVGFVDPKERTKQPQAGLVTNSRHAGKPRLAALPIRAHRHGFSLIIAVMRRQEMKAVMTTAPIGQERVAGLASTLLESRYRLVSGPGEARMPDLPSLQPLSGLTGLLGGVRSQTMVDGEPDDMTATQASPVIGEQREGEAVGAAGDGDGQERSVLEGAKPVHAGGEGVGVDGMAGAWWF